MFRWEQIKSWERFEELSLYLIDEELHLNTLNLYLKKGYKQFGIDIKGFDFNTGYYTCVQCKLVDKFNPPDLQSAIDEFKKGTQSAISNRFILVISTDLNTDKFEKVISDEKILFKENFQIDFECWDKSLIERKLKKHFRIEAQTNCFQEKPPLNFAKFFPVENFIERDVNLIKENTEPDLSFRLFNYYERIKLQTLFIKQNFETKKICILGEPQDGKSTLLKQTAYDLMQQYASFVPILVELKTVTVQSIKSILNTYHPSWMQFPSRSLIIILDGLDEVPSEKIIDMTKHINAFNTEFPTINLIFSCRNLFYERYRLKIILNDIKFYQLSPVSYEQSQNFLFGKLGNLAEKFNHFVVRNDIRSLAYKPFFLNYLSDRFLKSLRNLPNSKIKILNDCISESFYIIKTRQISNGRLFEHKLATYKKCLNKLSFALQLALKNAFHDEEMQILFSDSDMELLQQSPLISLNHSYWSFNAALFQEHIAADVLSSFDFSTIQKFVSVGSSISKIKIKWIQTLASCLSVLENLDEKYKKIIELFKKDNFELLTLAEPGKFTEEERLEIIKAILSRYEKNDTLLIFNEIRENNIGAFLNQSEVIIKYLLQTIKKNPSERLKITCWRILQYSILPVSLKEEIRKLGISEIFATGNGHYAKTIVDAFSIYDIGNVDLIDFLLDCKQLLNDHDFRSSIYNLLFKLNLVDKYYSFGLKGFAILFQHNKHISHAFSEQNLENFLLGTKSAQNFKKLLQTIVTNEWLGFYHYKATNEKSFINRLTQTAVSLYEVDNTILFSVVDFFRFVASHHSKNEFEALESFFNITDTSFRAVQIYFLNPDPKAYLEFYSIVNQDSFDYLLYLLEDEIISSNDIKHIIGSLRYAQKNEIAELLYKAANDALEDTLYDKSQEVYWQEYYAMEEQKKKNDIKYIQSRSLFISGVKSFFKDFGKQVATSQELYIDLDTRKERRKAASNLVYRFLNRMLQQNDVVFFKDCLERLNNENWFENFRIEEILHYNFTSTQIPEFKLLLKEYYYKYITATEFKNGYYYQNDTVRVKIKAQLLSEIFLKYEFQTQPDILIEMIWMDRIRINDVNNRKKALSLVIFDTLDEKNKNIFKEKVIEHLLSGIKNVEVFENHFELCAYFKITEVIPLILEKVISNSFREWFKRRATDIYLELGGSIEELIPVFKSITDFNDYYFWYLVPKLMDSEQQIVVQKLSDCLSNPSTSEQNKIEAAKYLSMFAVNDGFAFLMDKVRTTKSSPITIQSGFALYNVNTAFALNHLKDITYLLVDSSYYNDKEYYQSPRSLLIEILSGLASKSESDLLMVDKFLKLNYKKYKKQYSNAKDFLWYAERNLEQFRKADELSSSVNDIKKVIDKIG